MYPTRLNVISPQKQRHIRRMLMLGFMQNVVAIMFIVCAIFSIFTIFAQVFLQSYFADVTLQSLRTQNPTKQINERVVAVNNTLQTAHAIQAGYNHWSPLVVLIANTIPDTIAIQKIRFVHSSNLLELVGTAPSRESLLGLKNSLESLDEIERVTVPLSDLTKQDEIHFSLSIPFVR